MKKSTVVIFWTAMTIIILMGVVTGFIHFKEYVSEADADEANIEALDRVQYMNWIQEERAKESIRVVKNGDRVVIK